MRVEVVETADIARGQSDVAPRLEIAKITGAEIGMAELEFLQMVTARWVGLLGTGAAGLLLADGGGGLRVTAASDERAHALQLFEVKTGEGPGHDCYRGSEPVVNQPLNGVEGRWPRFSRHAFAAGFTSAHAFPLRRGEDVIGTLNLLSVENPILSEREAAAGQAMADVATIGLLQTGALEQAWALAGQLQGALTSRIVIEQAKVILAERNRLDVDGAFSLLRTYARDHTAPLRQVATAVVETTLPAEIGPTPFRRGGKQPLPGRRPPRPAA